ncbi:MAG: hypothetical protein WC471_05720 [Candidatus Woesearchaeota archaeon]
MNSEIKKDVLDILNRVIVILDKKEIRDVLELKEISDHTLHDASIFQDKDSISIGVLVYALAKVFERDFHDTFMYNKTLSKLKEAKDSLQRNDIDNYRLCIKEITSIISKVDFKFKMYVEQVLEKARIKKGSSLFAHGLSMARVSEMLNISQWELMNYVGKTKIIDREMPDVPVKQRLKLARALFK